jgi:hypothetical protein
MPHKIPAPKGGIYALTENVASPFHAEPRHSRSTVAAPQHRFVLCGIDPFMDKRGSGGPFTPRHPRRQQPLKYISDHQWLLLSRTSHWLYDRSNPFGPRIFISQPSFSREPTFDTRQSPSRSLRACSTNTRTSAPAPGSPVFCG